MTSYGVWQIYQTNFAHPDIKTGQHTNGPARIWIKSYLSDFKWIDTKQTQLHKVRKLIDANPTCPIQD